MPKAKLTNKGMLSTTEALSAAEGLGNAALLDDLRPRLLLELEDHDLESMNNSQRIKNILATNEANPLRKTVEVTEVRDSEWIRARARFAVVQAFLGDPAIVPSLESHARAAGIHPSTLYRWMQLYRADEQNVLALLEKKALHRRSKFSPRVEEIVQTAIKEKYLTAERPSKTAAFAEAERLCLLEDLPCPSLWAIKARIHRIDLEARVKARHGTKFAREMFSLHGGGLVADGPLAMVQMDHTKVDKMIVDEDTRRPIGRPFISVAIDIATRMILGFTLSLDEPSILTMGLALAHSILPKEAWLAELGISGEWPCSGIPRNLALDNAMEFRSETIVRACEKYGINIQWRPLGKPEFGGHIERFMRTFALAVHELPGTTFSNINEKGDYKSHEHACMTLRELESWIAQWIIGVYHLSPHAGLDGKSPLNAWTEWSLKMETVTGSSPPSQVKDPLQLRLDLLPLVKRTVQEYGLRLHGTVYQHDVLRKYVHSEDGKGNPQEFIVRYDPRDISIVYFWDPGTHQYFPIPWRDISRKPCSIWESKGQRQEQRRQNSAGINRKEIALTRTKLGERMRSAKAQTLKQRRVATKRKHHEASNVHQLVPGLERPKLPVIEDPQSTQLIRTEDPAPFVWQTLRPFEDIE